MRCRGCGEWLPWANEETRFCGHCGRPVDVKLPQPPALHQATLGLGADRGVPPRPAVSAHRPAIDEPAPIPLTRRKHRAVPPSLVAVGSMLGNDMELGPAAPAAASGHSVRPDAHLSANSNGRSLAKVGPSPASAPVIDTIEAEPPGRGLISPLESAAARAGSSVASPAITPPQTPKPRHLATGDDLSGYPPFSSQIDVNRSSAHNFYAGFEHELSAGGLFVSTCAPLERGERVLVTFTVPGFAAKWTSRAVVEWSVPYDTDGTRSVPGMGLHLLDLDPQLERAASRFMQQREPIFYESPRHSLLTD